MRSSPPTFLGCNWGVLTQCQPETRLLWLRKSKPRKCKKKRVLWIQPLTNNSCSAPNLSTRLLFSPSTLGAAQNRRPGMIYFHICCCSVALAAPPPRAMLLSQFQIGFRSGLAKLKGSNQKYITAPRAGQDTLKVREHKIWLDPPQLFLRSIFLMPSGPLIILFNLGRMKQELQNRRAVLVPAALIHLTRFLRSEILTEVMLQGGEVLIDVIQVLIGGKSLASASSSARSSRGALELLPFSTCNNSSWALTF